MKLKQKHFDIAATISYFVDRSEYIGFPNFIEPTREQIEIFSRVESYGRNSISDEEFKLAEPMFSGKENYDLQIKMVHEEIAEFIVMGWGWYPPLLSIMDDIKEQGENLKIYLNALYKIKEKIEETSAFEVIMGYSGFSAEQRERFREKYFNSFLTRGIKRV